MRYQTTEYHCGPASVQNALIVLGERPSQARLAQLCGTTAEGGTDEDGIKRAVLHAGYGFDVVAVHDPARAWAFLVYHLMVGRPVILCVDRWAHWVTAIGACGKRAILAEPARLPYAQRENGVLVLQRDRLLKRWAAARRVRGRGPRYYGIAIGPA